MLCAVGSDDNKAHSSKVLIYRFGPYEADAARGELRKFGLRIRLERKPWQVLVCLLERPGEVVSRRELQRSLWGDNVFVEFETGLNVAVTKLRTALCDSAEKATYLETIAGEGYRFVGPIVTVSATAEVPPAVSSEPVRAAAAVKVPFRLSRRTSLAVVATIALLAILLTFGYRLITRYRALARAKRAPAVNSVFVQKEGALDPVDEGFQVHRFGEFRGEVMRNAALDGFDRLKITSDDQGYYYRPFNDAEKEFAVRNDWKLTCVCAVQQGSAFAAVDFGTNEGIPRFDIGLLQEDGRFFVALTRHISPKWEFEKVEFRGAADVNHPHTYELRYDHKTKTASLWIDGQLKFSGYRGVDQFMEDRGLFFGSYASNYSKIGIEIFRSVRFETY
jgi:DNA-binding winged helix-turn-helix (wHTH) protein